MVMSYNSTYYNSITQIPNAHKPRASKNFTDNSHYARVKNLKKSKKKMCLEGYPWKEKEGGKSGFLATTSSKLQIQQW